jgi:hypothetical protein
MAVANLQDFKQALDGAILARPPMEQIECNVRAKLGQDHRNIALDVDAGNAVTEALQRDRTGGTGAQRYFAFRRPAAHQDRDMPRCGHEKPFEATAAVGRSRAGTGQPS